jgi:hypothetical protein
MTESEAFPFPAKDVEICAAVGTIPSSARGIVPRQAQLGGSGGPLHTSRVGSVAQTPVQFVSLDLARAPDPLTMRPFHFRMAP